MKWMSSQRFAAAMLGWTAAVVGVLWSDAGQAASPRSALVLPPVGLAVTEEQRAAVAEELRLALPAFDLTPMSRAETAGVAAAVETMGVACALDAVECIVQLGGIAAVDVVLAGLVAPRDGVVVLDLLAVDVGSGALRGRTQTVLSAEPRARKQEIEGALAALLRPEVWRGFLTIGVDRPGAQVVIDGIARGFTPMKRPLPLSPGPHQVFVGLEGFRAHRESVVITYAGRHDLKVRLVPGPSEPPPLRTAPAAPTTPAGDATKEVAAPERRSAPRKTLRVALYEPSVAGVPARVVTVMQDLIAAELRKRERVSVLGTDELRSFLRQGQDGADVSTCSEDQCLADVADALGVDVVVLSQFTEVGGELFFGLRRIDQDRQEVAGSYSAQIPASELAALLPHVGKSVTQTFGDIPLRAGQTAGVDDSAGRKLSPPPLHRAVTIGIAAGSGVVLASSAGFAFGAFSVADDWNRAVAGATDKVVARSHEERDAAEALHQGLQGAFWSAIGLGAALGAGAAVAWQFTDWEGLADEESAKP
jgi:hypothetical protein